MSVRCGRTGRTQWRLYVADVASDICEEHSSIVTGSQWDVGETSTALECRGRKFAAETKFCKANLVLLQNTQNASSGRHCCLCQAAHRPAACRKWQHHRVQMLACIADHTRTGVEPMQQHKWRFRIEPLQS